MIDVLNQKDFLQNIPKTFGVYKYYNTNKIILYVGKAKVLKNRVSSYFQSEEKLSPKVRILMSQVNFMEFIVTESEHDALLLENSLIKELQPKYNVLLKDSKTFPWICVKKERFPRIFTTRKIDKDGSQYFGPYTSVIIANGLIELIHSIFKIRTCSLVLNKKNIEGKKFVKCLEYHIGKCNAPCENLEKEEDYQINIELAIQFLKRDTKVVLNEFEKKMNFFAEKMDYENAQKMKERIGLIHKYQSKSLIVSQKISNADVFSIIMDEEYAYVNFMKIVEGCLIQLHSIEIKRKLNESQEEILASAILEIRNQFQSDSPEIIVPILPELAIKDVEFTIPKIGDKLKLIEFSLKNLKFFISEQKLKHSVRQGDTRFNIVLETMKKDLNLKVLPVHIECFDNSNIQGTNPVSSCVVFKNAKPSMKDYRIFNVKTVEGIDDFASMEEVIYRRYKRLKEENQPLPNLIIIDGGKGQLGAAYKSLEKLELHDKLEIISIAKRLEEIFMPHDKFPLYLNVRSESLKLIQQCRDEAHRFGLKHHRNRRSKGMMN